MVRCGRLRWFGHVERKSGDDWVSACRNVVLAGVRCVGRGRKTWRECVKDDTDELGLHPEWAVSREYVERPHIVESLLLDPELSEISCYFGSAYKTLVNYL